MTEVTNNLYWLVVFYHGCDFFFTETYDCGFDTFLTAVTYVSTWYGIGDFDIVVIKYFTDYFLYGESFFKKLCKGEVLETFFKHGYGAFLCKWHKLDDEAAGCFYRGIVI